MRQRPFAIFPLVMCGILAWASVVHGETPRGQHASRPTMDASPESAYRLSESNGPWLIMAATFSGDGAENQACNLVQEFRSEYNLPAYVYRMTFDLASDAPMRGVNRYGQLQRAKYQRGDAVTEFAVLVGDFPSVEDTDAQRILKQIKQMEPKSLSGKHIDRTTQNLAGLRAVQNILISRVDKTRQRGPMGHAFITRNPRLPDKYFVPRGIDPFVVKMNRGVRYSLLDCPGRYTVKVATFRGRVILQGAAQAGQSKLQHASQKEDPLVAAAENAHNLTVALRARGWDEASGFGAYEFHDRYESIVTIGSFDHVVTRYPNGEEVPTQNVQTILRTFGATYQSPITDPRQLDQEKQAEEIKKRFTTMFTKHAGQIASGFYPKYLIGIPFDIYPQVMEVPRRSISSDYVPE